MQNIDFIKSTFKQISYEIHRNLIAFTKCNILPTINKQ